MKRCPVCHREFSDKILFCDQDGASLVKIAPAVQAKLMISQPDGEHREVILPDTPVTLGKLPDNEIFIEDTAISRKHARIEKRGESHYIKDLNSLNGTLVNGQNIGQQEIELKDGDEIGLGRTKIVFHLKPAKAEDGRTPAAEEVPRMTAIISPTPPPPPPPTLSPKPIEPKPPSLPLPPPPLQHGPTGHRPAAPPSPPPLCRAPTRLSACEHRRIPR